MNETKHKFAGTLEQQRVVNALLNGVQLRLSDPVPNEALLVVEDTETMRVPYVRVGPLLEDVAVALGIAPEVVRLALESALDQGLLVTPSTLPRAEVVALAVRPTTL